MIILCNSTNAIASKNSSVDLCYICRPHSWLNLCLAFYVARVYEVRHLVTAMNVASLCKTFVRSYHELNNYTVQHVDDSIPYNSQASDIIVQGAANPPITGVAHLVFVQLTTLDESERSGPRM